MTYRKKGKRREVHDGAGLCSPGRWALRSRLLPNSWCSRAFSNALEEFIGEWSSRSGIQPKDLLCQAACGKLVASPWNELELKKLKDRLTGILAEAGTPVRRTMGDRPQAIDIRFLQAFMEMSGDPES